MTNTLPVSSGEFQSLSRGILSKRIYLDNACLTPTPPKVAEAVAEYYRQPPGCPLRSNTQSSQTIAEQISDARDMVRKWIGAMFSDEIVFTLNTTLAINLLAGAFSRIPGAILVTDAEHNSNRLPWLSQGIVEVHCPPGFEFPMEEYKSLLTKEIKLVSMASISNVTGAELPVREIIHHAHALNIPVHIDAAQQATHQTIDIMDDQPDFLSLSLHKAYGPTGLGILYIRRDMQEHLKPLLTGGGSVDDHFDQDVVATTGVARFEFGLQNYAAQYAVPETISFLQRFPAKEIQRHFAALNTLVHQLLAEIPGVHFIGPENPLQGSHICNFHVAGKDSRRLAELLDRTGNIHVRAGKLCAHHYYHRYSIPDSIRISFGYHNTEEDMIRFAKTLRTLCERYL